MHWLNRGPTAHQRASAAVRNRTNGVPARLTAAAMSFSPEAMGSSA
jgi:hypothetical protein